MRERNEQEQIRFDKLNELREKGNIYPNNVEVNSNSKFVKEIEVKEPEESERLKVAGRIVQKRIMGKASFVHIQDRYGKLQLYVRRDDVGTEAYSEFKQYDIGDIVEVSGYVFMTRTEEKTIHAEEIRLLTKSLIPLPEKWHGLSDVDSRFRHRYIDLIANPEVRDIFEKRAKIIRYIRNFLDTRGYLEVETSILSDIASGAIARPFKSHYNALNTDMNLRIALELPLKKLIVGGFERVYEIGKNFRNEGLSKKHSPEFTMMEFYEAYADYNKLIEMTEELISGLVEELHGSTKITYGDKEVDFSRPWKRVSMKDSISEIGGVSADRDFDDVNELVKIAEENNVHLDDKSDWGHIIESLWGELVEPKLINPTFITEHPFSISPFARKNDDNPKVTDRFELIVAGMELANAFSELNDPIDQLERLLEQAKKKTGGELEVADLDEDYIRALEYGMPPTAGEGIGIDRLVMLLTNSHSIREVILFPQLKPLDSDSEEEKSEEEKEG